MTDRVTDMMTDTITDRTTEIKKFDELILTDLDKVELYKIFNSSGVKEFIKHLDKFNKLNVTDKTFLLRLLRAKTHIELNNAISMLKVYCIKTVEMHNNISTINTQSYTTIWLNILNADYFKSCVLRSSVPISYVIVDGEKIMNTNSDLCIMKFDNNIASSFSIYVHRIKVFFVTKPSKSVYVTCYSYYYNMDSKMDVMYWNIILYKRHVRNKQKETVKIINRPVYKQKIQQTCIAKLHQHWSTPIYLYKIIDMDDILPSITSLSNIAEHDTIKEFTTSNLITLLAFYYIVKKYINILHHRNTVESQELHNRINAYRLIRIEQLHRDKHYNDLYQLVMECITFINVYVKSNMDDLIAHLKITDSNALNEYKQYLQDWTPYSRWLTI